MEIALIPGVLALGETIVGQLCYAAIEYEKTQDTARDNRDGKRHSGIYCSSRSGANQDRSHSGIYCNPRPKQVLQPVTESRPEELESTGTRPLSPLSSGSDSANESPCPTARLILPASSAGPRVTRPVSPQFGSVSDGSPSRSPYTASLLMPTEDKLCPSTSNLTFAKIMADADGKRDETPSDEVEHNLQVLASMKTSTTSKYLHNFPPLSFKNMSSASDSTCSDLDTSTSSVSTVSSMAESVPLGASSVDQKKVSPSQASGNVVACTPRLSKARLFCRSAHEMNGNLGGDLDDLDAEMAELTKDLEMLRSHIKSQKDLLVD